MDFVLMFALAIFADAIMDTVGIAGFILAGLGVCLTAIMVGERRKDNEEEEGCAYDGF